MGIGLSRRGGVAGVAAVVLLGTGALVMGADEKAAAPTTAPTTAPAAAPTTAPAASPGDGTTRPATAGKPDAPATAPAKAGPGGHIVQKGDLSFTIQTEGVFLPADASEVKLQFKAYMGPVQVAAVAAPGAFVRKGDTLLEIDRTWYNWQLIGVEHEHTTAKLNLARVEVEHSVGQKADAIALRSAEDLVRNADDAVRWFENVDGPQMHAMADLIVKNSQNSVDDQNDELEQLKKMYKDDELTAATADIVVRRAVRSLDQSKVLLKMQEQRRDKAKAFDFPITKQRVLDSAATSKLSLEQLKAAQAVSAATRNQSLAGAKIAVEQVTRRLNDLKEDGNLFLVKSPADGTVAYGTIENGMWVGGDPKNMKVGEKITPSQIPGNVVMRVYTPGKMKVQLNLPEQQAFWVEGMMTARVTPASMPHLSYEARTGAPEVAPRGQQGALGWQLTLDTGDVDRRVLPGMKASVTIDAGKVEGAVLVPNAAVTAGKVSVRKDGQVSERNVVVGRSDGQNTEIRQGLREGEEVIIPGKK